MERMKSHTFDNTFYENRPNFGIETTRCCRCGALMKPESALDLLGNDIGFMAAQCIRCGEIVDPLIFSN